MTTQLQNSPKSFDRWFGFLFFGGLLVWAAISYRERIGYLDSSAYLCKIIENEAFYISHNRFGSIFTQVIPLLLVLLKAPLHAVMLGYSLNFILLYLLCYWLCLYRWHNRRVAYSLCLFLVLGVGRTFYWPVTEMYLSLVFCLTFYAWWTSPKERAQWLRILVATLLIYLSIHTYGASILALFFLLSYDFWDRKVWRHRSSLLIWGLLLLVSVLIWQLKGTTLYEQKKLSGLYNLPNLLPHLWEGRFGYFFSNLHGIANGIYAIGLVLTGALLILHKKWMKLLVVLLFFGGYFLVLLATYLTEGSPLALENALLPLSLVLAVVIFREDFTSYRLVRIAVFVWLGISFLRIGGERQFYIERGNFYETMAKNLEPESSGKLVIHTWNYNHAIPSLHGSWSTFYESLLYSATDDRDGCFMINVVKEYEYEDLKGMKNASEYLSNYPMESRVPHSHLPSRYFPLKKQPFTFANTAPDLAIEDVHALLSQTTLDWVNPPTEVPAANTIFPTLRIRYSGPGIIPSGVFQPSSFYLTHRFYHKGELVDWQRPLAPLVMDVNSELLQRISVQLPDEDCDLEIEFSLIVPSINAEAKSDRIPIQVRN